MLCLNQWPAEKKKKVAPCLPLDSLEIWFGGLFFLNAEIDRVFSVRATPLPTCYNYILNYRCESSHIWRALSIQVGSP